MNRIPRSPLVWKVCGPRSIASHLTDRLERSGGRNSCYSASCSLCPSTITFANPSQRSLTSPLSRPWKYVRIDTGVKLHLAGADSANVTRNANCWTCNLPGHLSHEYPHAGAIKDLQAASPSGNRGRRSKPSSPPQALERVPLECLRCALCDDEGKNTLCGFLPAHS